MRLICFSVQTVQTEINLNNMGSIGLDLKSMLSHRSKKHALCLISKTGLSS